MRLQFIALEVQDAFVDLSRAVGVFWALLVTEHPTNVPSAKITITIIPNTKRRILPPLILSTPFFVELSLYQEGFA